MSCYYSIFYNQRVTLKEFLNLRDKDLRKLGFKNENSRKKLLDIIYKFRVENKHLLGKDTEKKSPSNSGVSFKGSLQEMNQKLGFFLQKLSALEIKLNDENLTSTDDTPENLSDILKESQSRANEICRTVSNMQQRVQSRKSPHGIFELSHIGVPAALGVFLGYFLLKHWSPK
eukprot:Sdes_comp17388_c0_seq1m6589